jgi:hypothetical protein
MECEKIATATVHGEEGCLCNRLGTYQVLVRLSDCDSVRGCNWSLC